MIHDYEYPDDCSCEACIAEEQAAIKALLMPQNKVEQVMACVEAVKERQWRKEQEAEHAAKYEAWKVDMAARHQREIAAKEEALLAELLAKRGLVAVPRGLPVPRETVSPEPENTTPAGLLCVSAVPGLRMGSAAWTDN